MSGICSAHKHHDPACPQCNAMTRILKTEELRMWQLQRITHEKAQGQPMFMGFPDRWYESPTYLCINLHVSKRYLKSEHRGPVCLACSCFEPLFLVPPETTEENIKLRFS